MLLLSTNTDRERGSAAWQSPSVQEKRHCYTMEFGRF
jgi:hypothetical protein